jgi:Lar family restriction alleviation protein
MIVTMVELRPCPFCGDEAVLTLNSERDGPIGRVTCGNYNCNARVSVGVGSNDEVKRDVVAKWNRRALLSATEGERDQLAARVKELEANTFPLSP